MRDGDHDAALSRRPWLNRRNRPEFPGAGRKWSIGHVNSSIPCNLPVEIGERSEKLVKYRSRPGNFLSNNGKQGQKSEKPVIPIWHLANRRFVYFGRSVCLLLFCYSCATFGCFLTAFWLLSCCFLGALASFAYSQRARTEWDQRIAMNSGNFSVLKNLRSALLPFAGGAGAHTIQLPSYYPELFWKPRASPVTGHTLEMERCNHVKSTKVGPQTAWLVNWHGNDRAFCPTPILTVRRAHVDYFTIFFSSSSY